MRKYSWNLIGIVAISISLLFFALPAFAASTLQVKCTDASGNAIANAKVVVENIAKATPRIRNPMPRVWPYSTKWTMAHTVFSGAATGLRPLSIEFVVLKGAQQSVDLRFVSGEQNAKLHFEDPAVEQNALNLVAQGGQALQAGKLAEAKSCLATL